MPALYVADHAAVLADLAGAGWQLTLDDDGGGMVAGWTADGRELVGLFLRDSIISDPTLDEMARADLALQEASGLVVLA